MPGDLRGALEALLPWGGPAGRTRARGCPYPSPFPDPYSYSYRFPYPTSTPTLAPTLPLQVDRKPTWFFGRIQGANEDGTFEVRLTLALALALALTLTLILTLAPPLTLA